MNIEKFKPEIRGDEPRYATKIPLSPEQDKINQILDYITLQEQRQDRLEQAIYHLAHEICEEGIISELSNILAGKE